jgi:class 3 adenylate cyclase/TolB-like protein
MTTTRRLAAILAADVAGYSRLMGADEEGTHERLKAHLGELVNPKIAEHRGRIVKNTGDGLLAEFASVVDAVRCAVEVQGAMADREPEVPDERRIGFRIGINLGDIIVEDDDIYGDGVNVATRLEALAEPGGICIARVVRDQIRDKLPYAFEDLGEQSVKNIARPVRVYALRPKVVADLPASSVPPISPVAQPIIAPRLSIVVLPFANLSSDPEQQHFADGITEDLTIDLSRIADMFARNTAFTYQGKRIDTKQIGHELGVRYMLEGSVRRLGNQIRINVQLIDAATDAHLWAERLDALLLPRLVPDASGQDLRSSPFLGNGTWPHAANLAHIAGESRSSGRLRSTILVVANHDGRHYLVSMLGDNSEWVRNVRAAGGEAFIKRGRSQPITLIEIPSEERAPILKVWCQIATSGRHHLPVRHDAPVSAFEAIAKDYQSFGLIRPARLSVGGHSTNPGLCWSQERQRDTPAQQSRTVTCCPCGHRPSC